MQGSAASLLTIINDILDVSKIEAGKLPLEMQEFDLRDLVLDTLKGLKVPADAKRLSLVCDVEPDVPARVLGDPGRLRQVLINLIGNAIKFTERGDVSVAIERSPEEAASAALLRARHRNRDSGRKASADLRCVHSGGRLFHPEIWRHRARFDHRQPFGSDDGRTHLGGEPRGPGQHVPFHRCGWSRFRLGPPDCKPLSVPRKGADKGLPHS